ncbi:MAG: diguanylate cyclase [Eubacteriales bacterium]
MDKNIEEKLNTSLNIRNKLLALTKLRDLGIGEFLDRTLEIAISITGSKIGYIFLYNEEKEEFILHSWSDAVLAECMVKDQSRLYYLGKVGLWGEVVRKREPIIINDYEAPHMMKKGYPEGHVPIHNFISIPVFDKDKIVAVVGGANKESDYLDDDILNLTLLMNTAWPIVERIKTEEVLKKEREYFRTTLFSINEGIIVTDIYGKITLMNPVAEKYTGWTNEEAYGKEFSDVYDNVNLQTKERGMNPVKLVIETGNSGESPENMGLIAKDGSEIYISGRSSKITTEAGEIAGVVISFQDKTKEYQQEKEIEGFLNVNLDMLCVADSNGKFIKVNKKFQEVLGYTSEALEGQSLLQFVHEDDIQGTLEKLEDLKNEKNVLGFINRYRCKDGTYKYIEWQSQPGAGNLNYSSARDITEKRILEEKLRKSAIRDKLTGLYNRNFLDNIIEEQMERSDRYNEPISLIMLDIDNFKEANDKWGHPVGDEILKMISQIINSSMRGSDILIRFGGEEFLILMPQTSIDGAKSASEKIRSAIEGNRHQVVGVKTASFGVAERMRSESFMHWYRRVDNALYDAKQRGKNRVSISDGLEKFDDEVLMIKWKNEWNSGNIDIDMQHQNLVKIGNKLISMANDGYSFDETIRQLDILLEHTIQHFESEEKILSEIGYKDYLSHSAKHNALAMKAIKLKESFITGEVKSSAFFSFILDDVVLGHLIESDMEFFQYLDKSQIDEK